MTLDAALRRRLQGVALRGLASAAQALAGDDPEAVCQTLRRWNAHQHRELPWLAGPGLSALRRTGVTPPPAGDLKTVERFLVGAETDPQAVMAAVDRCVAEAGERGAPLPPDASGALADAVDRFFDLLVAAFAQLHQPVGAGHRRKVDEIIALWQDRLDEAADDIEERAKVLSGEHRVAAPPPKPAWGSRDRPGCALAFVVIALLTAAVLVWAVMQGWPAQPVDFGL